MLSETLSQTDLTMLPVVAMVIFLAAFVVVVTMVLVRGANDPNHDYIAALPLGDDSGPFARVAGQGGRGKDEGGSRE